MVRKHVVTGMAAGLLLVMAAGAQAQPKTKGKDEAYDTAVARHLETARALARGNAAATDEPSMDWIAGLTSDRRARSVNDLITVRVVENIEAAGSADAQLNKASSASVTTRRRVARRWRMWRTVPAASSVVITGSPACGGGPAR